MNNIIRYGSIFYAMLLRDLLVLRSKIVSLLIDSSVVLVNEILILGLLYPQIGMSVEYIAPLFIGSSVVFILIDLGYSFAMRYTYNVPYTGYAEIQYHLLLPLPKWFVFAEYIVYFVIESLVVSVPLLLIGVFVMPSIRVMVIGSWALFWVFYVMSVFFFGIFFMASSFWYTPEWFKDNMWPRRLNMLLCFSSVFYPWYQVDALMPWLAKLLLLNPLTYVTEGMRAALLGDAQYVSLSICVPVLIGFILFDCWRLKRGVYNSLDPV